MKFSKKQQAEMREELTQLLSKCYSVDGSVCDKHSVFQPHKFLNKFFPWLAKK